MRIQLLSIALLAIASAMGEGYITSVTLPNGETKTIQDEVATRDIQSLSNAIAAVTSSYETVSNAAMNAATPEMVTNIVGIVTNDVDKGFSQWTVYRAGVDVTSLVKQPEYLGPESEGAPLRWKMYCTTQDEDFGNYATSEKGEQATEISCAFWNAELGENISYTATRHIVKVNAFGLARLVDLPTNNLQLANGAGYVTKSITNGLATTNDIALTPVYGGNGERYQWGGFRTEGGAQPADYSVRWGNTSGVYRWELYIDSGSFRVSLGSTDPNSTEEIFQILDTTGIVVATRTENSILGYTLGSQTNEVLAATNITNGFATVSLTNNMVSSSAFSALNPFDFSTNAGLYLAVSNIISALGGSVTNFPSIPQGAH